MDNQEAIATEGALMRGETTFRPAGLAPVLSPLEGTLVVGVVLPAACVIRVWRLQILLA
jgi:hypothetical protein